jgi:hypothetical protein
VHGEENADMHLALVDLFNGRNPFDAVSRRARLSETELDPPNRLKKIETTDEDNTSRHKRA